MSQNAKNPPGAAPLNHAHVPYVPFGTPPMAWIRLLWYVYIRRPAAIASCDGRCEDTLGGHSAASGTSTQQPEESWGMKRALLAITLIVALAALAACSGGAAAPDTSGEGSQATPSSSGQSQQSTGGSVSSGPGRFARVEDMSAVRESPSVVLLPDGRPMVVGGRTRGGGGFWLNYEKSADVLDLATGKWTTMAEMSVARAAHALIVLSDGRVLAAGGEGEQNLPVASAEIWDPATNSWTPTQPMNEARDQSSAALLSDGRVLIAGGRSKELGLMAGVEIFDPATNSWTQVAPMSEARYDHIIVALPDGRVLVAGGGKIDGPWTATAEVYD
ncbi:MAG: hypothetical protein FJ317_09025, partial [SAR202 cluster bacterium]|nr:hypothetical protein [SAR202 cluster bacterium]